MTPADPAAAPRHPADDVLVLGAPPRPTTGDELAARLLAVAQDRLGPAARGLDRARASARLDGDDVAELALDLTGVVVPVSAAGLDTPSADVVPHVDHRTPGVLRRFRVDAHPVTVADVAVDVAVDVQDVPFAWIEGRDAAGEPVLAIEPVEPTASGPVRGDVRVAAPQEAVLAAVRRLATEALAAQGVTLTGLDVALTSHGPRAARVVADARIRKGILGASARLAATVSVDAAMVVSLADVEVSSRNPVVAALLVAVRGRLEAVERERVDLAAVLPPGVRIVDVRVDVGRDLVLTARAG